MKTALLIILGIVTQAGAVEYRVTWNEFVVNEDRNYDNYWMKYPPKREDLRFQSGKSRAFKNGTDAAIFFYKIKQDCFDCFYVELEAICPKCEPCDKVKDPEFEKILDEETEKLDKVFPIGKSNPSRGNLNIGEGERP